MSLGGYSWDMNEKDKWHIIENLMVNGVKDTHNNITINPSDYDFTNTTSIIAWNKAWAKYFAITAARGNDRRPAYLKHTIEMRKKHPRVNYITSGKKGGVNFRNTPFPEPEEIESLEDWVFDNNNNLGSTEGRDVVINTRIITSWWVEKDNNNERVYPRSIEDVEENGYTIYRNHTYNRLLYMRDSTPKMHLFKNQFKIDRSILIPNYHYIQAYINLNVDNYLNLRKKHTKITNQLLTDKKHLDEWLNVQWIENYIDERQREWADRVNREKEKEKEARILIENAENIVNNFEGVVE